jgi:hypothetical protein
MGCLDDGLTGGIAMNRRHDGLLDADTPTENLHHGRDAVRGATGARDDDGLTLRRIHTVDNRLHIVTLRR